MLQGDGLAASKGCITRLCMSMKVEEGGYMGDRKGEETHKFIAFRIVYRCLIMMG